MARTIQDEKLGIKNERKGLSDGKPHWRTIHEGLHLGYRKGKRGGKWLMRYGYRKLCERKGKLVWAMHYRQETIAPADDVSDADGISVLSWGQAQEVARTRATELAIESKGGHIGPYTVDKALDDYFATLEANGRDTRDARQRAKLHIRPHLGKVELSDLTAKQCREWLAKVARHPGFTRGGRVRKLPPFETAEDEAEYRRGRQDSANRILTVLKAALNHAFNEGMVATNAAWAGSKVAPFRNVSQARPAMLSMDEVRRLINAAEPGFRELVQGALYTGARYGDLTAMSVGDFDADNGLVMSGNSKASRPHPVYLTDEAVRFFERITAGRGRREPMFPHPDGGRWHKSQQSRPMARAIEAAKIETPISFHGLRHTYCSHAIMAGVPMLVVANNVGHADTRMIERHYGHLAQSWVRDQVQAGMPSWGDPGDDGKVEKIAGARA